MMKDVLEKGRTLLNPYFDTQYPLVSLGVALAALLFGLLLHWVAHRIVKRIAQRRVEIFWDALVDHVHNSSRYFIMLLCLIAVKPFLGVEEEILIDINHIIALLTIGVLAWLFTNIVTVIRISLLSNYDITEKNNLQARKMHTQFKLIANIIKFLIIVLAVGLALMTFEGIRRVGMSLLASAGIAGIILGFAAQRLIATILAGLQIALTQPIRLEDVVIVEGEWGRIEEITLTYVVVRIWDKRRLVVPTIYFIEKPFQNWTRVSADILGTVYIYADYTLPVEAVRQELTRILQGSSLWDGEVNVLQVTDSKERTMELRALISAPDSSIAWDLRVYVREQLIKFLQKNYPDSLPRTRIEINNGELPTAAVEEEKKP